jgi:hypothetical protein
MFTLDLTSNNVKSDSVKALWNQFKDVNADAERYLTPSWVMRKSTKDNAKTLSVKYALIIAFAEFANATVLVTDELWEGLTMMLELWAAACNVEYIRPSSSSSGAVVDVTSKEDQFRRHINSGERLNVNFREVITPDIGHIDPNVDPYSLSSDQVSKLVRILSTEAERLLSCGSFCMSSTFKPILKMVSSISSVGRMKTNKVYMELDKLDNEVRSVILRQMMFV